MPDFASIDVWLWFAVLALVGLMVVNAALGPFSP
jgi:hypothetical protein